MGYRAHLLVISNVVPKIWARTNSAMADGGDLEDATGANWSGSGCVVGVVAVRAPLRDQVLSCGPARAVG